MMPNLKLALLVVVAAPLGSCTTLSGSTEPAVPAGHNFSYLITDRERIHLTQAFDDGSKTYLEFDDTPTAPLDIRESKDGEGVSYIVDQRYVIVPGVHATLAVTVAGASATVVNQAPLPDPVPAAVASAPTSNDTHPNDARTPPMRTATASDHSASVHGGRPSTDTHTGAVRGKPVAEPLAGSPSRRVALLQPKISMLDENIRRLGETLDAAHSEGLGDTLYLRSLGGAPRVVVKFAEQSAEVHVDDRLLGILGDAARSATRIVLHGSTDSFVASATSTELALRRAVEVKRLLISLQVDPARIRLYYRGAGNFIANNSTPEGRALNRRVEMELRKW